MVLSPVLPFLRMVLYHNSRPAFHVDHIPIGSGPTHVTVVSVMIYITLIITQIGVHSEMSRDPATLYLPLAKTDDAE